MFFRKIYFIDKRFQTRFILKSVLIVLFWAIATVGVYSYLIAKKLDSIRYSSHVDVKTTGELLMPITLGTHLVSLLVFAAILAVTMQSVWEKLSPPLFSIKKDLATIASGDLSHEVSLCEGEEFQELADEIEKMRQGLRVNILLIKEHQHRLSAVVSEIENSIHAGNIDLTRTSTLQSTLFHMKESVQVFNINPL